MPDFKIVITYFQEQRGWSEVFYRSATSLQGAAAGLNFVLGDSATLRDQTVILKNYRVTDVLNLRSSLVVPVNITGQAQTIGGTPAGPEPADVAAIVNLASTTVPSSRKWWIRGLPDSWVTRDPITGVDRPDARLLSRINQVIRDLIDAGIEIRSYKRVDNVTNYYQPIVSLTPGPSGGTSTVTFVGTLLPTLPGKVIMSQFSPKVLPGLNGVFPVLALPSATTFVIPYTLPGSGAFVVAHGRWRPAVYQYGALDITKCGFSSFNGRATGRPTTTTRGRRHSVRLRSL